MKNMFVNFLLLCALSVPSSVKSLAESIHTPDASYIEEGKAIDREAFDLIIGFYTNEGDEKISKMHRKILWAIAKKETIHGILLGDTKVYSYFEEAGEHKQAKALEKIAALSNRRVSDYLGSYAGALGYMQFMPTTFHIYMQDGNDDGIKDILNPHDSIATAASFYMWCFHLKKEQFLERKGEVDEEGNVIDRDLSDIEISVLLTKTLRCYNNSSKYVVEVLDLSEVLHELDLEED